MDSPSIPDSAKANRESAQLSPTGQSLEILRDCLAVGEMVKQDINNKDPRAMEALEIFQHSLAKAKPSSSVEPLESMVSASDSLEEQARKAHDYFQAQEIPSSSSSPT